MSKKMETVKEIKTEFNIRPVAGRLIVENVNESPLSLGGIILTEKQENYEKGKVVAVGRSKILGPGQELTSEVSIGETIFYYKHVAIEMLVENNKYFVLNEKDILAIQK